MSNLVVVVFEDETTAFDMRTALVKMQKNYLIEMEDAVVVTKDAKGKVQLHQAVNLTAAGAVGGGFWGTLIGMIFLNPLVGAAVAPARRLVRRPLRRRHQRQDDEGRGAVVPTGHRRAVRPDPQGDGRQGAGRTEAVCRQGQGVSNLAGQGHGGRAACGLGEGVKSTLVLCQGSEFGSAGHLLTSGETR